MRYFSMAALAVMGLMMSGCSSDDNFLGDDAQGVSKGNVVTLTTTVGLDEGSESKGTSRALAVDFDAKKATKTFAAGEKMALVYKNTSNETVKVESDALAEGDIVTGGKSATFTFTLTDPNRAQDVTYIYPAAMATDAGAVNYDALASQNGTLATLSSGLDLATYTGAWTGGTSLPAATLDNQLAILALTLKNSTGSSTITSGLTQVTVNDGTNTYTVTPTSSTFGTDVIYVAIRPVTAALSYTATDGTTNYTKTATSREYAACNFYNLGLRMAVSVPSFTVGVTGGVAKKVFFAPGNLQYNTSESTYKWRFAENQYDVIGTWNTSTWVDLFGWGTWTGSNPSKVTNTSTTGSQYSFDNADFSQESILADATQRSYDWRTLSKDEWVYVFNTRTVNGGTGAGKSYTLDATVGSREGVVLYPDNYTGAVYSGSNWASFEAAGCVFLPGAGYRSEGTSMYAGGRYWSSTPYNSFAYYVDFDSDNLKPQVYNNRYSGYSVRLVRPVE